MSFNDLTSSAADSLDRGDGLQIMFGVAGLPHMEG
jgi:hypothetical protein